MTEIEKILVDLKKKVIQEEEIFGPLINADEAVILITVREAKQLIDFIEFYSEQYHKKRK
jgi:hypothetical protein